ncbi:hypothetical protein SPRG_15585 [Saprolegnia parasitica CBS 223.65]|uniref:PH domain-containing protein n=1 Tax=Saprolegnia parasitica (strain CBS 223.65) TaxID=695850 RepID=A0A067BJR2_SAPPC|nr:hypothetical protein SPRG_15585 [Saprolegnia parasitica CBS 223.65]KDO18418.1 hypothetical protein SPRG_15585 [Saprolegnia parasitica CBS 223.65]|eukprot:XP_012210868.1 hypothetical protein SPRG_15585 [Saprolegnia parasitica CBS 223.65]
MNNQPLPALEFVKTGFLFKRGAGGLFGRKNWKPRYFELTDSTLRYYSYQKGKKKGELRLDGIGRDAIEVMPADSKKTGTSKSTIWRIAIQTPKRRLLLAASTEYEMNEWIYALSRVVKGGVKHRHSDMTNYNPSKRADIGARAESF